jgi:hypothetical protein
MALSEKDNVPKAIADLTASWQRSDISQLTLYIPYQVELTGCQ